jgi:hypothetical protein
VTVERIDWQAAARDGATVVYGVLIAGLPYLLVGDTVSVTGVTWTDTADPAWHVGTSPTTRPWLKLDDLVIEERIRPLDGGFDVSSITLRLADIDGGVTAVLGARDALTVSTLADNISASSTTVLVRSVAAAPSSGVVVSRWGLALVALLGAVELVAFIALVARRRATCAVQVVGGQCSARCEP